MQTLITCKTSSVKDRQLTNSKNDFFLSVTDRSKDQPATEEPRAPWNLLRLKSVFNTKAVSDNS